MTERPLEGLSAIVTGGGSGIGRATALALADAGAIVVIAGRRPGRAGGGRAAADDAIEQIKERERAEIPLGRRGEPEEIASMVVALGSPAGRWVTGQLIGIDGGFSLV